MADSMISRDGLTRALVSLEGLSCGDAFGEQFFSLTFLEVKEWIRERRVPTGSWPYTDDTMMAVSIFEMLRRYGVIREDELAAHFASLFDPMRGYGSAMHDLLPRIAARGGQAWREEAAALFEGRGSFGNGSAMRVAPLGAYFADDLEQVVSEAAKSAVVTHLHPEAVAGAIAVAVGAAQAWRSRDQEAPEREQFLTSVLEHVPESDVRRGVETALGLPATITAEMAGMKLGNGSRVTAMDTVPFVLWAAGSFLDDYEEALWQTLSALGDKDTTCAMVGGIVALRTGVERIPVEWLRRREPFHELLGHLKSDYLR